MKPFRRFIGLILGSTLVLDCGHHVRTTKTYARGDWVTCWQCVRQGRRNDA
jgi:hypothetical protein